MVKEVKGTINRKEIDGMKDEAAEAQKILNNQNIKKAKRIQATRDKIWTREERLFEVEVPVDMDESGEEEVWVFKVKRLTQEQRAKLGTTRPYDEKALREMGDEEYSEMVDRGYEVLSEVVVEPEMSADEWRKADLALTQQLILKIGLLQYQTNDAALVNQLKN